MAPATMFSPQRCAGIDYESPSHRDGHSEVIQTGSVTAAEGRALKGCRLRCFASMPLAAQVTRAELSNFQETSSYSDVLSFLDSLQRVAPDIRIGTLAVSPEGRRVPYVLASHPLVSGPADAHRSGKLIVYLQANIHAGEVEGKEAAQMLVRDLAVGPLRPMLDHIVLLVAPIYNTDGNEHMAAGEENRPGQNGPARVGRNSTARVCNLNRDYVKMEAPRPRAPLPSHGWDPDLFIRPAHDNGQLPWLRPDLPPGLNSNSNPAGFRAGPLSACGAERMQRLHRNARSPTELRNQDPDSLAQGWETYDAPPEVRHQLDGAPRQAGRYERGLQHAISGRA